MQHDISNLRDQVQQVSLAQKGTESKMDCLKKGVEAKMNDMEAKMDDLKIDLKTYLKITIVYFEDRFDKFSIRNTY